MHQREVDVVLVCPLRDGRLRLVQHERRGGRALVLRGVGVAQHDLHLAAGLGQAALDVGELKHLVQGVDGVLEVLHLLEQGDDVEHGHVLLVREGKAGELVDVGHVLGALREADDVAARGLHAVAALDRADGAEGV